MTMTRKDYRVIAAALNATKPQDNHTQLLWQWRNDVNTIVRELSKTYSNFNHTTFYVACGYGIKE